MSKFGDAFSTARKAGKKEFTFEGKRYHTRTREEEAQRTAPKSESKAAPKSESKAAPKSETKVVSKTDPRDTKRNIPREIITTLKRNAQRDTENYGLPEGVAPAIKAKLKDLGGKYGTKAMREEAAKAGKKGMARGGSYKKGK